MANSADVNAGDDVLASQYNNLRKDVLDTSTGHDHDGAGSKALAANAVGATQLTTDAVETAKIKNANVTTVKVKTGTGSSVNMVNAVTLFSMHDYSFFPNIHCDGAGDATFMSYVYESSPPGDTTVGRLKLAIASGTHDAYWKYITTSGPPEIWIVRDNAKGIYTIWEADDPAPGGEPPILCLDKDGNSIGETIKIILPGNYAEMKAKAGPKKIGKVLLEEWEIDEQSDPKRPAGLPPEILVKRLKKKTK